MSNPEPRKIDYESRSDAQLAADIAGRDAAAVRLVTRRNTQRLLRTARSILKNREDAEDTVQSAYLKAFAAIGGYAGRSSLSTWLTRIVINDALTCARAIRRRRSRLERSPGAIIDDYSEMLMRGSMPASPDSALAREQIRHLLEDAIGQLPESFRTVFMLRDVEHCAVADVARMLGIPAATVKTRHLRARRRLRELLGPGAGKAGSGMSLVHPRAAGRIDAGRRNSADPGPGVRADMGWPPGIN